MLKMAARQGVQRITQVLLCISSVRAKRECGDAFLVVELGDRIPRPTVADMLGDHLCDSLQRTGLFSRVDEPGSRAGTTLARLSAGSRRVKRTATGTFLP